MVMAKVLAPQVDSIAGSGPAKKPEEHFVRVLLVAPPLAICLLVLSRPITCLPVSSDPNGRLWPFAIGERDLECRLAV